MVLVSIITPSYNSSNYIAETIYSVINQSFTNWEMIIVDDNSTDNSIKIIQSFIEKDSRIKLIQFSKNSGSAVARNKAIEIAKGRYIAFLDSDDIWISTKLERQLAFMQENNFPFTYTAYDKIDEKGKIFGHIGVSKKVNYKTLLKTNIIGCLTAIYDTNYFGRVAMPLIRKRQDFGLWLELLKKTEYAYGLNESLARYRVCSDSVSSKKYNVARFNWYLYRRIEKLTLLESAYYFSHYIIRGILRTNFPRLAKLLGILN